MWLNMDMTRVNIAELKNHLSHYLRAAEQGNEIEVTDRRRPIVRLVPAGAPERRVRIVPARRSFVALRAQRYPRARWRTPSLALLLEERGKR